MPPFPVADNRSSDRFCHRPRIQVLCPLPEDLRRALAEAYDLREGTGEPISGVTAAVTTSMGGADRAALDRLPDLRLLACQGAGLDRIDGEELARRGIKLVHTPDAVTEDTADMAVALVYAVLRGVVRADAFVRAGMWERQRIAPSRRVAGRWAGVVGLGRIGRRIADRLAGAGLRVAYTGPRPKDGCPYPYHPTARALAEAVDILVLSCPGGPETRHLVDAAVLERLGPEGVLINVSRGSVVDEEALIQALTSGGIAGAGLDVFEDEPAIDPRFKSLPTAVLQPHAAAVTVEARADMIATLRAALAAFFANGEGEAGTAPAAIQENSPR